MRAFGPVLFVVVTTFAVINHLFDVRRSDGRPMNWLDFTHFGLTALAVAFIICAIIEVMKMTKEGWWL